MKEEERHNENSEKVVRIGTYGKSKHPEEHFHVKLFPWAGKIGQPYTVDSTFEHNNIHKDQDGNVFSIFVVEEPEESWYSWEDEHIPLGTVKVRGSVIEDYNSIVRPGYYEIKNSEIIEGSNVEVKRIVTWSRPFVLQAKKGDNVEAVGLLEKVKTKSGEEFHQVVLGYFDTYSDERGEKEYLKKLIN